MSQFSDSYLSKEVYFCLKRMRKFMVNLLAIRGITYNQEFTVILNLATPATVCGVQKKSKEVIKSQNPMPSISGFGCQKVVKRLIIITIDVTIQQKNVYLPPLIIHLFLIKTPDSTRFRQNLIGLYFSVGLSSACFKERHKPSCEHLIVYIRST